MSGLHTSGPWELIHDHPNAETSPRIGYIRPKGSDRYTDEVAVVYGCMAPAQKANAHLIAAAPELLELLKAVSAALYINDYGDWALNSNFKADGIDQVIAKATGSGQ